MRLVRQAARWEKRSSHRSLPHPFPTDAASRMRFGEVLARSVYGTTGFIGAPGDLELLESRLVLNVPLLRQFECVVVASNFGPDDTGALARGNRDLWRRFFPDCVILDSPANRGHSIGTADLDNLLFDHCKAAGHRWLCKSSNDIVLRGRVLDIPVVPAQFYFINAVSYDAIAQHDFDLDLFAGNFFYPQDTFWVIDVEATDQLVDKEFLDRSWRIVTAIPDYNGRIWEHMPHWSCELLLRNTVLRNHLSRCSLLSERQWLRVLELTVAERITDCSLKGIEVNGICHSQDLADPAIPRAVIA
mgnify:FL=1